jgi:hypothetical protein
MRFYTKDRNTIFGCLIKKASEHERRFFEHMEMIELHEPHVGNIAAPTSSALIYQSTLTFLDEA